MRLARGLIYTSTSTSTSTRNKKGVLCGGYVGSRRGVGCGVCRNFDVCFVFLYTVI